MLKPSDSLTLNSTLQIVIPQYRISHWFDAKQEPGMDGAGKSSDEAFSLCRWQMSFCVSVLNSAVFVACHRRQRKRPWRSRWKLASRGPGNGFGGFHRQAPE